MEMLHVTLVRYLTMLLHVEEESVHSVIALSVKQKIVII